MTQRVYLDHNASSPLRPEARDAMLRVTAMPGNPSSVHTEGRALRAEIEGARRSVAALVGAKPANVVFTSGATEAANWVGQRHALNALATEHLCVLESATGEPIAVNADGTLAGEVPLETAAIQIANSETGVLPDVRGQCLADAVQAAGRIPLDMAELDCRYLLLSAHKIGGPRGVGALVLRDEDDCPQPIAIGGGQENRHRAGTENVAGIAGFGAAAQAALRDLDDMPRIEALRDRLEAGLHTLSEKSGAQLSIFGQGASRLPNTSNFALHGVSAQTALIGLDLAGIAVSSGSACSSGSMKPSHVLAAMGVAEDVAACAIRVSLGWTNDEDDVAAFLAAYEQIAARAMPRAA